MGLCCVISASSCQVAEGLGEVPHHHHPPHPPRRKAHRPQAQPGLPDMLQYRQQQRNTLETFVEARAERRGTRHSTGESRLRDLLCHTVSSPQPVALTMRARSDCLADMEARGELLSSPNDASAAISWRMPAAHGTLPRGGIIHRPDTLRAGRRCRFSG